MTEAFLHYVWQHSLFDRRNLISDDGQSLEIIHPGLLNTNAGPDFFNSQIIIDGTLWAGNVEIHMRSSEWKRHNHHVDKSYDNCILHVVLENDEMTFRTDGTRIPVVEIRNRFSPFLWENYLKLIGSNGWIPCQNMISRVNENTWKAAFNLMNIERLEKRANQIFISLKGNKEDWEETFYQGLLRNFGFRINAIPFELLSRALPLKILKKEIDQPGFIEALIFGQAGMLSFKFDEPYPENLKNIYSHLSKKYSLQPITYNAWKFLRLRPVNFPAVRLAQLSALLSRQPSLFNTLIESQSLENIYDLFNVKTSDYWNTHYHFSKTSQPLIKKMGRESVNNILINTFIPYLFAWGKYAGKNDLIERAYLLLEKIPSENNFITRQWKDIGVIAHSAGQSQALLQLKQEFCSAKKCLECLIGQKIIEC